MSGNSTGTSVNWGGAKVQSDWAETDVNAPSYIQNKPDPNGLKTFYVDGNNSDPGDGSVLNPFKTIDFVIDKVIGSGSISNPQYSGVTIEVAGYGLYTTAHNLYIQNTTWDFKPGSVLRYTGTHYLIDSSEDVIAGINAPFKISGEGTFITSTGGFIRNVRDAYSQTYNGNLDIEVYLATGLYNSSGLDPLEKPFIYLEKTNVSANNGYNSPNLVLRIKNRVWSYQQSLIVMRGATNLRVFGQDKADLMYGSNLSPSGIPNGLLLDYNNNDATTRSYNGSVYIENCTFRHGNSIFGVVLQGSYGTVGGFYNCNISSSFGDASINRWIALGEWVPVAYSGNPTPGKFIISNCTQQELTFNEDDIIDYFGSDPSLNKLDMQYNTFNTKKYPNPSINVGGNIGPVINKFNGQLTFSNLPNFVDNTAALTAGLNVGDIYRNAGIISVVV